MRLRHAWKIRFDYLDKRYLTEAEAEEQDKRYHEIVKLFAWCDDGEVEDDVNRYLAEQDVFRRAVCERHAAGAAPIKF